MWNIEYQPGFWGELVVGSSSSRLMSQFVLGTDEAYNSYTIRVLALKTGNLVYNPNYLVITKDYRTSGDAVEIQFLSQVKQALSKLESKKVKVDGNPLLNALNKIQEEQSKIESDEEVKLEKDNKTDSTQEMQGVTGFYSGQEFTLVAGPYPDSMEYMIRSVLQTFENLAKPYIDNNLARYYIINSNVAGNKTVFSEKGKLHELEQKQNRTNVFGYYKYVINAVLRQYPSLHAEMSRIVNSWHEEIPPQKNVKSKFDRIANNTRFC
jgi:hypothetical protein